MSAVGKHEPYEKLVETARSYARQGEVIKMARTLVDSSERATLTNADSQSVFDIYWENGIFKEFKDTDLYCPNKNLKSIINCLDSTKDWRNNLFKYHIQEFISSVKAN